MKNDFLDELIKEKLNQQQYEFTEADWSAFESKQASATSSIGGSKWLLGGAAATVIIAVASYFYISNQSATQPLTQEKNTISAESNSENTKTEETNNTSNVITLNDKDSHEDELTQSTYQENKISKEEVQNDEKKSNNTSFETQEVGNPENTEESNKTPEDNLKESSTESDNSSISQHSIDIPSAVIMSNNLAVCPDETVSFETLEQKNVIYAWSLGDETYSNQREVSHHYSNPGKYTVSLIVTSTIDHSILSKSKDIIVEVLPTPNTNFDFEYEENSAIPSIKLSSSEALNNYFWDFGDGTHSKEATPVKSFKRKGYYNVTLTSKSHEGCKSSTTQKVTIKEDYNLLAPNSFTPNGDGINDFFVPEALKTMDAQFTMTIYSQNEGLIFETSNINQQWDGRNQQNGKNCGEGTYIWVVSLVTPQGKSEQYKGAVLLLNK